MRASLITVVVVSAMAALANPSYGQVIATLDETNHFILQGRATMSGLDIMSPGGALIPIEGGTLSASAAPFTFLLSNTENQITYGNLGTSVELDGALTLSAGWNPFASDPSVTMAYGDGPTPRPITLFLEPCEGEACPKLPPPPVLAGVDADRHIVLKGTGQELSDITFRSASNSLVPTSSPAPFAQTLANTPAEVQLASPGASVKLDGNVTLGVGWNERNNNRDIEFEYQLFEGDAVATTKIPKRDYADYKVPTFNRLITTVNEDDHFVIRGSGQPITEFSLISPAGSIEPSETVSPFSSYKSNTPEIVTLSAGDSPVVVDGELVLATKWNWHKPQTVSYEYDLQGEIADRSRISVNQFPDVPAEGREPLLITLDEDNNFVLTGIGQELGGVQFTSTTGALRVSGENTPPFPLMLKNTPEEVTVGVLGRVVMDGSFVMDFGPVSADRIGEIDVNVGYEFPVSNPINTLCDRCDFPDVSVTEDRGLVLTNFTEPVTLVTFRSKNGGLQGFDQLPEGVTLLSGSPTEVVLSNAAGFNAEVLDGLPVLWGGNVDGQVFVSFSFVDGTSFGPLPLALTASVPEPASAMLLLMGGIAGLSIRRKRRVSITSPA